MINVTVWNEYLSQEQDYIKKVYPLGIHGALAEFLKKNKDFNVKTATLLDDDCGLTDKVLDETDVMLWWGHCHHDKVPDAIAKKVAERVQSGMGIIFLHSAHVSKPFKLLMGTSGSLKYREVNERERLWVVDAAHPITKDLGEYFELDEEEMYGEKFDIPTPDELLLIGWFEGGNVFRSGCTFKRGAGKIFYFQPGHETNPTYYKKEVQSIITNAVRYCAPVKKVSLECFFSEPLEHIAEKVKK